ncbi:hypothetical protein [Parendozoicomonas haliclonae]|uniref:Uncharacterized protein n=1 Tax=Parendozoicomonas haliclonae TaxID=1960125 RepID=A0A1X7ANS4_9GAMM|nr:hypothetical protein [Parendozoicomonas haliclonae]SMA48670.1 hypothetical protein EHSB41UT_02839 [Parendozoicomonas haliclonae]
MRRNLRWLLIFLLSSLVLLGVPAVLLFSWSVQINETRQWAELTRFVLMIMLPVLPLVLWYSKR